MEYQIQGWNIDGEQIIKIVKAENLQEADQKAIELELKVNKITVLKRTKYKLKTEEKLNFIRLLSITSKSGLPILQGLKTILQENTKSSINNLVYEIIADLEEGESLSNSLMNRKGLFNNLSIALIKAGEISGKLTQTLDQLYEYENKSYKFKKKLKSALTYPFVIFSFSFIVVLIFLMGIVPKFKETYTSFGSKLPPLTEFLLNISEGLLDNMYLIFFGFIFLISGVIYFFKATRLKVYSEKFIIKIPLFGRMFFLGIVIRFARTLGTLVENKVNFIEALFLAKDASNSKWFQSIIEDVIPKVKEGESLSEILSHKEVIPPFLIQMIKMGEESGRLGELLISSASFYQEDIEQKVETIDSALQPIIIIFLGVFIGALVLALFLPMFDLPSVIQ